MGGSHTTALIPGRRLVFSRIYNKARVIDGGRARFENPDATETIERDLLSSVQSQSLTDESEADEVPIKHDRAQ